jgi:small-conductance mechanosensitive channel
MLRMKSKLLLIAGLIAATLPSPQMTAAQQQSSPPAPVPAPSYADLAQWDFRREMEALAQIFSSGKILLSLLFLLLGYLIDKLIRVGVARLSGRRNIYAERFRRVTPFISFGLWLAVVLVIVQIFTQSLLAMVLLITIAVLALAFASQPLLRDLIGGIVILFERPFQLGDRIVVGDHEGEVKEIGLWTFQLASADGSPMALS